MFMLIEVGVSCSTKEKIREMVVRGFTVGKQNDEAGEMIYLLINKFDPDNGCTNIIHPIRIMVRVESSREAAIFIYKEEEAWLDPNSEWDLLEINEENLTVRKVKIPRLKFDESTP